MSPLYILQRANAECLCTEERVNAANRSFGKHIAQNRKVSRAIFAKKLGVTGAMLALMETGKRRWPMERAELAVKLLTRREQWPQ